MGEIHMPSESHHPNKPKSFTEIANLVFPYFLIIAIGVLCYSGTFDASFNFDDIPNIVQKESIRNPLDIKSIWAGSKTRFVADFSFAINYAVNGLQPFGYHLVNLIIHILTAITLYWFVILLFITPELRKNPLARHAKGIALAVALVFTSHPIETQAVTYIVQRITSLASLFYLLSLALYLKARLYYDQNNRRHSLFYAGSLAAALLAMFTKEISVTLPICILIVEYFFFSPSFPMIWRRVKYLWPMLLTLLVVPINYLASMGYLVRHFGVAAETDTISRMDYLLTQFNVIRTYLRLLIFPANQSVDYSYPISHSFLEPATFASFLLLVSLLALAFFLFRKFRLLSFGIVWFFLTLLVESSVIPIRDVIFEHRLYLPSMGIFLAITVLVFYALGKKPRILFALFALVVLLASLGTVHRNVLWKKQVLLWHDAVGKRHIKERTANNLGIGLITLGRLDLAIPYYDKALDRFPRHAKMYFNRGMAYQMAGNSKKAVQDYTESLKLYSKYHRTYFYRAIAYIQEGNYDLALEDLNRSIRLSPNDPAVFYNRSCIHFELGDYKMALKDVNRAIELQRGMSIYFRQRALVYIRLKKPEKALEDLDRAILLAPGYVNAYEIRGKIFEELGRIEEAIRDLKKIISLEPDNASAYYSLGMIYQNMNRLDISSDYFKKAEKLNPDFTE